MKSQLGDLADFLQKSPETMDGSIRTAPRPYRRSHHIVHNRSAIVQKTALDPTHPKALP